MSLFGTKQWWRTVCGSDECFDRQSLLVGSFSKEGERGKEEMIIVASHMGHLRIYRPSSRWDEEGKWPTGYRSTDLLVEAQLDECIVDAKLGMFVSGSQDNRLAIIGPSRLTVYTVTFVDGTTEHGDRCELSIAYEHQLPRFPATLTVGPFGGVRGRDFLCVQCIDGTLLFYEQEVFAFSQVLSNRLLPGPIVYAARNDLFVTASSAWIVECYRYQSMADSSREKEGDGSSKKLEPDWRFNIGEPILGIEIVTLTSFEVGIVALGERNLYCLKDSYASLKYAKRLEYRPICFRAYVIEPDGRLMVMVVAETNTLMVYEGTTLKWSAQLPFTPVAVARANLQNLQGLIVILSEYGHLEACYLGSEPALFVAPPLHRRGYDYAMAEKELAELRSLLRKSRTSGVRSAEPTMETELIMTINVQVSKETGRRAEGEICNATIELSSYATIRDLQVCVDVCKPLVVTDDHFDIPNLCDRHVLRTAVRLIDDTAPVTSSEVLVTASYRTDNGGLRVLRRIGHVPLGLILRPCPPENSAAFTATIKRNESLIGLGQLFPELTGDQSQRQNWNTSALGLRHARSGHVVTIVSGSTSNRYRVQSSDGAAATLVLEQLVNRLTDRSPMVGALVTSVTQNHLEMIYARMDGHYSARRRVEQITNEIGQLGNQLRNIERRMLRVVRERNDRPLPDTGLPFLLESTFTRLFGLLDELALANQERERSAQGLRCCVRLLLILLRLYTNQESCGLLEAAIGFEAQQQNELDWEEIADVCLAGLSRAISRRSATTETRPATTGTISSTKELAKLKKRLAHVVDRLDDRNKQPGIPEAEPLDHLVPN